MEGWQAQLNEGSKKKVGKEIPVFDKFFEGIDTMMKTGEKNLIEIYAMVQRLREKIYKISGDKIVLPWEVEKDKKKVTEELKGLEEIEKSVASKLAYVQIDLTGNNQKIYELFQALRLLDAELGRLVGGVIEDGPMEKTQTKDLNGVLDSNR